MRSSSVECLSNNILGIGGTARYPQTRVACFLEIDRTDGGFADNHPSNTISVTSAHAGDFATVIRTNDEYRVDVVDSGELKIGLNGYCGVM